AGSTSRSDRGVQHQCRVCPGRVLLEVKRRQHESRLFRSYPMRLLARISIVLLLMGASTGLLALQRGGYQSDDEFGTARQRAEQDLNGESRSEYSWSRLRCTAANSYAGYGGYGRWSSWSRDYPKADRQFLIALRRLTRIQARPVEQVVDLDSDGPESIENFPWVYAVQAQTWTFTEPEAKRMRDYLLKGGFLMV